MPYFEKINMLFIHIPKTGGTSVEEYFYEKLNLTRDETNLFSLCVLDNDHSLQHYTYSEIKNKTKIIENNPKIITIVRNPYTRIVSDILYLPVICLEKINKNNMFIYKSLIEKIIKRYLQSSDTFDNHKTPQYQYLMDESGNILSNITILKQETLNSDMKSLGYLDFEKEFNVRNKGKINYFDLLTKTSIKMINEYYSKDFEVFGYEKF